MHMKQPRNDLVVKTNIRDSLELNSKTGVEVNDCKLYGPVTSRCPPQAKNFEDFGTQKDLEVIW